MFIQTNLSSLLFFSLMFRFTIAVCKFPGSMHNAYFLQNFVIQLVIIGFQDGVDLRRLDYPIKNG